MTEKEKLDMTRLNMKRVRHQYVRLLTELEAASESRGAVTSWGSVGGRSGRISRPTQQRAISRIELEDERKRMRDWFESIRATFFRLSDREGKSVNRWRHERLVARALQLYVFEKADADMMAALLSGPRTLSRQYVSGVLKEGVREVMADAEKAGLFEGGEPESRFLCG